MMVCCRFSEGGEKEAGHQFSIIAELLPASFSPPSPPKKWSVIANTRYEVWSNLKHYLNHKQRKGMDFGSNDPSICHKRQKVKNHVLYLLSIKSVGFVYYLLWLGSSETLSLWRPLARRAFKTRRPFEVDILSRNPCLFFLFLFEGWNVLFISGKYFIYDFISLI